MSSAKPSGIPIEVILSALSITLSVLAIQRLYQQHRAFEKWEAMAGRRFVTASSSGPHGHSSAFWGMMKAHGLEEGDPVESFIAVFGEPDSVSNALLYGDGVKCYTWKNDSYYWPQRKGLLLPLPKLPLSEKSPDQKSATN